MRQVLFTIPGVGISIFGYGAMLVLAFVTSTWLACWRARREKLDPEAVLDMSFWLFAGGLIGARLFFCIQYWGTVIKSPLEIFMYWKGGIVYYGGIFGGVLAFLIYRKYRNLPLRPYLDALAPSIAVGTLFGRLGCFLNGCCYGDPCGVPRLGVRFPGGTPVWLAHRARRLIPADAPFSLPVHPTQLYSAAGGLVLLALLSAYYPLRRRDGEVVGLLMIAYPVTRFLVETMRDDESSLFLGMTASQVCSLLLLAFTLVFWLVLPNRRVSPPATAPAPVA